MKTGIGAKSILGLLLLGQGFVAMAQTPTAPLQPASGPGGRNYPFSGVTTNGPYWANGRTTQDQYKYFIYEPAGPTPDQAPVILFLHGVFSVDPKGYLGWIYHMVRKGNVVVWVQWQASSSLTSPGKFTPNAIASWNDALYRLQHFWWENHVRPIMNPSGQLETMIVGHSAGGFIGANIAAEVTTTSPAIPFPFALVLIEPGSKNLIPPADYSKISPYTKIVTVTGDADTVVCKNDALRIWAQSTNVPAQGKNFLWVQSDSTGIPQQLGNHFFPDTDGFNDTASMDDRDFNVTWKLSVAAAECVFGSTVDVNACQTAFGAGSVNQVSMGKWSNGVAVKPLLYFANPATTPAIPGCP